MNSWVSCLITFGEIVSCSFSTLSKLRLVTLYRNMYITHTHVTLNPILFYTEDISRMLLKILTSFLDFGASGF